MFFSTEEDDDGDFTPSSSTGSKLSSLFGGGKSKSSNLKYVPPKQPRSRRGSVSSENSVKGETNKTNGNSGSATAQQQSSSAPTAPVVLMAIPVTAFLYVNNSAQPYGRVMCCILGNVLEKKFSILLYRSKQEHLTKAQIHSNFLLTVQPNNYASFADDQQRNWSINVDEANYSELIMQISICKAFCKGIEGTHIVQDLVQGNGAAITQSDSIQVSYTTWSIENCKKGTQDPNGVSSRRIRLSKSGTGWESGLLGACCNGRRLVLSQDGSGMVVYDVTIERVKGKGGEASGRNSPVPSIASTRSQSSSQIINHKQEKPLHSTQTPVNVLQEDTGGGLAPQTGDGESQSRSRRSSLKARMARVGHALLPPQATAHHTDSDSEWEEVSRRQRHLSQSSSIAESVEELSATPALSHSRSLSQEQLSQQQATAHHPSNVSARGAANGGSQQPQQVVVYQSVPWQQHQHGGVPAYGYAAPPAGHMAAGNSSVHSTPASATSTLTPSNDSTMSLLFSETRSQNTELRISVSKIQDKMDGLMSKFDALELNNQNSAVTRYGGQPSSVSVTGDPHALLEQITSLVTDNDAMKGKIVESEKKIVSLNESINLLLHKNQKLLEEKTDMLVSEQKSHRDNSSSNLTEVISLREEKAVITAHLTIAQTQCDKLKSELTTSQSKVESLEKKILEIETEVKQTQSQGQLDDSTKEMREKQINDMALEKNQLTSEVEEIGSQMKALQLKLQETHENLVSISQQLEDIRSERDSLKKQLEKSQIELQELKQNPHHNGNIGEDGIRLQKELDAAYLQIKKLEEKVQLNEACLNKEGNENLQVHVNELMSDKAQLELRIEELESSHSPDPSSSVSMVKKVMNGVFRSLKPKFTDNDVYEGEKVKQIILDVIRDTTLQLIENVQTSQEESKTAKQEKDEQTEENKIVSKDAQPLTDDLKHMHNSIDNNDKELHQTSDVDVGSNSLDDLSDKTMEEGKTMEDLSSVKSNQKEKDICHGMNISTLSLINGNDFVSIGDRDHIVDSDVNNGVNSLSVTTDVTSNKVPDLLSQISEEGGHSQNLSVDSNEIENEIGHKIDRLSYNEREDSFDSDIQSQEQNILTQNQNAEIKLPQNGEQNDSLNLHNSDSVNEQIIRKSNKEEARSDVVRAEVPTKDEHSRIPVIDMENTGHRYEKSDIIEKSDSSRDSSLERALRPQPPPPPLFTDEEDDDDWLS